MEPRCSARLLVRFLIRLSNPLQVGAPPSSSLGDSPREVSHPVRHSHPGPWHERVPEPGASRLPLGPQKPDSSHPPGGRPVGRAGFPLPPGPGRRAGSLPGWTPPVASLQPSSAITNHGASSPENRLLSQDSGPPRGLQGGIDPLPSDLRNGGRVRGRRCCGGLKPPRGWGTAQTRTTR